MDHSRILDLAPTEIDGQDLPGGPHLFCQVEGRNPVAGGNIEDDGSRTKIQMLQQRFGEGGGPVVMGRKRPPKPHISRAFGHVAVPLSCCRHRILHRPANAHQPFHKTSMVIMEGNKTSQTGTLRMILLWAAAGMKSPQILQVRNARTSPHSQLLIARTWAGVLDAGPCRSCSSACWTRPQRECPQSGIRCM